jgi:UDP-2-acetamido-2,6-beta-L-arabino-hexul-4-ose reductase
MSKTIGVTGPRGFIASHIIRRLENEEGVRVVTADRDDFEDLSRLVDFVAQCDVVLHLAAVNRGDDAHVYGANKFLSAQLAKALTQAHVRPHVIFSSSTQRDRDGAYGRSKREGELDLTLWAAANDAPLVIAVIPNVYGAGCKPFYNSVVATFCHQLASGESLQVNEDRQIEFLWVNDVVDSLIDFAMVDPTPGVRVCPLASTASLRVTELRDLLQSYKNSFFETGVVPQLNNTLHASLYSTFLSYVSLDNHRHRPQVHEDNRGNLFEIIKLAGGGQVFFSTTKPGVIRGNHYHTRKVEWFCVVRGKAMIKLRRIGDDTVHEFPVSGDSPEFISIPVLHTHSIENVGDEELLTMFWCNEIFDATDADTIYENVA